MRNIRVFPNNALPIREVIYENVYINKEKRQVTLGGPMKSAQDCEIMRSDIGSSPLQRIAVISYEE